MHQQVYKKGNNTFLRLVVARGLARVQEELNTKNLSLKIWDAYRPYSVTEKMWELIKDERYVADPKREVGIIVELQLILPLLTEQQAKNWIWEPDSTILQIVHTKISKICQREFWTTGHY